MPAKRVNVSLDEQSALRLSALAESAHVNEGTLARSLLSRALEDADPDARTVVGLLDGIDGAHERAKLGREQARRGETVALDEL